MNTIELYKRLPKTNCGKCIAKACMPFALGIIKGDLQLNNCPSLTAQEIEELKSSIKISDWREELITKLREKVKDISFAEIAGDIGAVLKDKTLVLSCLGREFEIHSDGEITTRGHITPWIKILILHYINTHGKSTITGRWVSFSDLRSGMVKATSFFRDCEEPLREMLDKNSGNIDAALLRIGASISKDFPSPYTWILNLLPKIPVAILYWPKEEEFESKAKILFDSSADIFLDVESLIFLLEGLVKNIEMIISARK